MNETNKTEIQGILNEMISEDLLNAKTLNINEGNAKKIYEEAYQMYLNGKFEEAKGLFSFLLIYQRNNPNFHYAFATCCYLRKEYEPAIMHFMEAGLLDAKNPLPDFYAADCFLQLKDPVSAVIALKRTIQKSIGPEYLDIKHRSGLILEGLGRY